MTFKTIIASALLLFASSSASAIELPAARCNESVFKPCICAAAVPEEVKYRAKLPACRNKAAVILEGEWASSFSVVLRDRLNRDRYPSSGYNGCSAALAGGESPPNKCSAFKVQKKFAPKAKLFTASEIAAPIKYWPRQQD